MKIKHFTLPHNSWLFPEWIFESENLVFHRIGYEHFKFSVFHLNSKGGREEVYPLFPLYIAPILLRWFKFQFTDLSLDEIILHDVFVFVEYSKKLEMFL